MIRSGALAWSPLDLPDLELWLDFSDVSTLFQDSGFATPVSSDADPIGGIQDKSGNGEHATQSSPGAKFTYKSGIQNGLSVGRADGGDYLDNTTFVTDLIEKTIFFVAEETSHTDNAGVFIIKPASGHDYNRADGVAITAAGGSNELEVAGSSGYSLIPSSTPQLPLAIYCERKTSGSASLYKNGGSAVATDSSFTEFATSSGGGYLVSGRFVGGSIHGGLRMIGDYCDMAVCSSLLSVVNTNLMGAYLANKWGLSWNDIS